LQFLLAAGSGEVHWQGQKWQRRLRRRFSELKSVKRLAEANWDRPRQPGTPLECAKLPSTVPLPTLLLTIVQPVANKLFLPLAAAAVAAAAAAAVVMPA